MNWTNEDILNAMTDEEKFNICCRISKIQLYDIIKLYEDIDKNAIYDDGERDCIGMFDDNEDNYGYIIYLDDMIMSLYQKLNNNSRYLIDKLYKNNVTSIYVHHEDL